MEENKEKKKKKKNYLLFKSVVSDEHPTRWTAELECFFREQDDATLPKEEI